MIEKTPLYKELRQSRIEWMNGIPTHWKEGKIKHSYEVVLGKMLQTSSKNDDDELLPYLRAANIQPEGVDITDIRQMWFSPTERQRLRLKRGDVLISEGGDIGRSCIWNEELVEVYFQNAINRARALYGNSSRFLNYWMLFLKGRGFIDILCNKATIPHYTAEKVRDTEIAIPPLSEQSRISSFLDYETSRIDTLIEKQKSLIELLKEKRQAVISHAVTRGLNPDVPLKDSGVEWLGKVPEHWSISRFKFNVQFVTSGSRGWAQYFSDDGNLFLRITNLTRDTIGINYDDIQFVSPPTGAEGERTRIEEGDILISITADLGSVAYADSKASGAFVSQHVSLSRPWPSINSRWLSYAVKADSSKEQLHSSGYGGTKTQLSLNDVRNVAVAVPSPEEQERIVGHIDTQLDALMIIEGKARGLVELLQEKRSALISAAVTGKIDVRDWTPPDKVA